MLFSFVFKHDVKYYTLKRGYGIQPRRKKSNFRIMKWEISGYDRRTRYYIAALGHQRLHQTRNKPADRLFFAMDEDTLYAYLALSMLVLLVLAYLMFRPRAKRRVRSSQTSAAPERGTKALSSTESGLTRRNKGQVKADSL
jgi:hypothetical protein